MRSTAYTLLLVLIVAASSWAALGLLGLFLATLISIFALFHNRTRLILAALLCVSAIPPLIALLLPAISCARESARRMTCRNQMKQIGLALHNYHEKYKSFPPACVADKDGKPMHSWRVLILPFMEQQQAYDKYRFDEPWDGPNNKKLLNERQVVFDCPSDTRTRCTSTPYTYTNYLAVVGPSTAWPGDKPRSLDDTDLRGKDSSTVLLVESNDTDIHWSEPRDMIAGGSHVPGDAAAQAVTSSRHMRDTDNYFLCDAPMAHATMADGSVRSIPFGIPANSPIFQIGGCTDEALRDLWDAPINWPHCIGLPIFLVSVALLLHHAIRSRRVRQKVATSCP